jgi:hypothetical protein
MKINLLIHIYCDLQWRLVGFIVEEANLNKHSNNKYTIIIFFLNILYRVPQNAYPKC